MKTIAILFCAWSMILSATAQGWVNLGNSSTTPIFTNDIALGGTRGQTASELGGFYYALFTANAKDGRTGSGLSPSAQELLAEPWTLTGLYGTNRSSPSSITGRLGGPTGTANGAPPFSTNFFVLVGWSSNLGHDWTTVEDEFQGANFADGVWRGPNFPATPDQAYFGISNLALGHPGDTSGNTLFLFGSSSGTLLRPMEGFDLNPVVVPEPSSICVGGLIYALVIATRKRRTRRFANPIPG
jgi:hypothetical protein